MKRFVIKDWAGNVLKEKTKSGLLVDLEFKSFDDAVDHLHAKFSYIEDENEFNDEIGEFYVDQVGVS